MMMWKKNRRAPGSPRRRRSDERRHREPVEPDLDLGQTTERGHVARRRPLEPAQHGVEDGVIRQNGDAHDREGHQRQGQAENRADQPCRREDPQARQPAACDNRATLETSSCSKKSSRARWRFFMALIRARLGPARF